MSDLKSLKSSESELQESIRKEKIKVVHLHNELDEIKNQFQNSQNQNHQLQQEIDLLQNRLMNNQNLSQNNSFLSPHQQPLQQSQQSQQSQLQQQQQQQLDDLSIRQLEEKDEMISRLNAKVSQTKIREQKLLDENAKLEQLYNDLHQEFFQYKQTTAEKQANMTEDYNSISINNTNNNRFKDNLEKSLEESLHNEKLLNKKLEILNQENLQYQSILQNMKLDLDQFQAKDQEKQRETDLLKQQNDQLQKDLQNLQSQQTQSLEQETTVKTLREKQEVNEKIIDKFEKEIVRVKMQKSQENEILQEQINQTKSYNEQYKAQIQDLLDQVKAQQNELQKKDLQNEGINQEKSLNEQRLQQLLEQNAELKESNRVFGIEIQDLSNKLIDLNQKTKFEQHKRDDLENRMAERIGCMEQELDTRDREYKDMAEKLQMMEETCDKLEKEKQELLIKLNQNEEEFIQEKTHFTSKENLLNSQLQQLKQDVQAISNKYFEQQKSTKSLKKDNISNSVILNSPNNKSFQSVKPPSKKTLKKRSSSHSRYQQQNSEKILNLSHIVPEQDQIQQQQQQDKVENIQFQQIERDLQMELQTKSLELVQNSHKIKKLEEKLQNVQEQLLDQQTQNNKYFVQLQDKNNLLEQTKKENDILKIQTKHIENADAKLIDELNELRHIKDQLMGERDRIIQQLELQEEERRDDHQIQNQLTHFVKSLESRCIRYQSELSHLDLQHKTLQNEQEVQIQQFSQQKQDLLDLLAEKEELFHNLQQEKKRVEYELQDEKDQQMQNQVHLEHTEKNRNIEVNAHKIRIEEIKEELENNNLIIAVLKEEMVEENRKHKEIIEINSTHLKLLKEKFNQELQELRKQIFQKQKIKEKSQFDKYIQQLIESISNYAQKESGIKMQKDKNSKLEKQVKQQKQQQQQLNQAIQALQQELLNCQKQMSTFKLQKSQKKVQEILDPISQFSDNNNQGNQTQNKKEVSMLEAKLIAQKTNNKMLSEEINFLKDSNASLLQKLENLQQNFEQQQHEKSFILKENQENKQVQNQLQKKLEQQKEKENYEKQFQQQFQDKQQQQQNQSDQIPILEQKLKEQKEEVGRKKDVIQSLKQQKEEREYEINQLKTELEIQKEDNEKLKRQKSDLARKEANFREFKEKYEQLKASEKKLSQEYTQNTEKIKLLKNEVTRKDIQIKDLKEKTSSSFVQSQIKKEFQQEEEKWREGTRKLQSEIKNKEIFMKQLRQKLEQSQYEIEKMKTENINKTAESIQEIDKEARKSDSLKSQLKKNQAQYEMLVFLLKRIFRENFVSYQKNQQNIALSQKQQQQNQFSQSHPHMPQNLKHQPANQFSESMNILNLSPEDIDQFLEPHKYGASQQSLRNMQQQQYHQQQQLDPQQFSYQGVLEKFEQELEGSNNNININNIYNMISSLIEDRITQAKQIQQ